MTHRRNTFMRDVLFSTSAFKCVEMCLHILTRVYIYIYVYDTAYLTYIYIDTHLQIYIYI